MTHHTRQLDSRNILQISLFLLTIFLINSSQADEPIADSFTFPLTGEWNTSEGFAETYISKWCGYHLGEDIPRVPDTPVFAVANGIVRYSKNIDGLGHAIHIEHELPDGSHVTSVYYHLKRLNQGGIPLSPGEIVFKDDPVGYITGLDEDDGTGPHLHLGIRKGSYEIGIDSRTNKWFYPGYTAIYQAPKVRQCDSIGQEQDKVDPKHQQIVSDWEPPSEFISNFEPPPPEPEPGVWQDVILPDDGETYIIHRASVDPTNANTIYVSRFGSINSTTGGHILKSTNGGGTWNEILDFPYNDLAIAPTNPNVLYAVPGGTLGDTSGVLFASEDGGATWEQTRPLGTRMVSRVAVDPTDPATVYATVSSGGGHDVVKSENGGDTWTDSLTQVGTVFDIAIDPTNANNIYIASSARVHKSTDAGATWTPSSSGLPSATVLSLAIDPDNTNTLYAGLNKTFPNDPNGGSVYKSEDFGENWVPMNNGLAGGPSIPVLAIDPNSPQIIYGGSRDGNGNGVYKSEDGGANWVSINGGLQNTFIYSLATAAETGAPTFLYVGTEEGVSRIFFSPDIVPGPIF